MQIDVVNIKHDAVECNLYTEGRCFKIYMHTNDYQKLIRAGFFIRDGREPDSANVLNTTET